MIKKLGLALISVVFSISVSAATFTEGKQYSKLDQKVADVPQVVEFFSFYCPHCYQFERVYHVSDTVKSKLPAGTTMEKYHVTFLGGNMGEVLTQAWAVAVSLGVQDKVAPLMFEAVQKEQTVNTPEDVRKVFLKAGVKAEEYDAAWDSFMVKALVEKQRKAAEDFQIRGVPAVYVNGQYMVRTEGLDGSSLDVFVKQFSDVVNYLVTLK